MTLARRCSSDFFPTTLENLFNGNELSCGMPNSAETIATTPAVNIIENQDDFTIQVAAPGLKKEDFSIELDKDRLTLSLERKDEKTTSQEQYQTREFNYLSFKKNFYLGENLVDTDKITAKYCDGILELILPKTEQAKPKPARVIGIQ